MKEKTLQNLFGISGKTILITGAGRGIGRALAEGLTGLGANIYVTATKPESLTWVNDARVQGRVVDVRNREEMANFMSEIIKEKGKLDCLINNAGIASDSLIAYTGQKEMDDIININFRSAFECGQSYYKLQRKGGGIIINIASASALKTLPGTALYACTKAALIQMTKNMAIEWSTRGFRVNCISPGFISTDINAAMRKRKDFTDRLIESIPLKRFGETDDLLGPVIFLMSDASAYMTGANIMVDGGTIL